MSEAKTRGTVIALVSGILSVALGGMLYWAGVSQLAELPINPAERWAYGSSPTNALLPAGEFFGSLGIIIIILAVLVELFTLRPQLAALQRHLQDLTGPISVDTLVTPAISAPSTATPGSPPSDR